jgi:mannose-1-phosphate guanylyltransferase
VPLCSSALEAVLLAAGRGTRLAPLTAEVPKILAPLAGRPLLDWQLRYLAAQGLERVHMNAHHLVGRIEHHLAQARTPVPVEVHYERNLLGTAGALAPMRQQLSESFLVMYGDVVTDASIDPLVAAHRASGAEATLVVQRLDDVAEKGVCIVDDQRRLLAFEEKPTAPRPEAEVNAGIHVLEPSILDAIGEPPSDFGFDVWPRCLEEGRDLRAYPLKGYLRDIGSPEALAAAERDLEGGALRW